MISLASSRSRPEKRSFLSLSLAAQHDDAQAAAHERHNDERCSDSHASRTRQLRDQALCFFGFGSAMNARKNLPAPRCATRQEIPSAW